MKMTSLQTLSYYLFIKAPQHSLNQTGVLSQGLKALVLSSTLLLSACDLGWDENELSNSEDDSNTDRIFYGAASESHWRLILENNSDFSLKKYASPSSSSLYTLTGTFDLLDTGFTQLTITSSKPSNVDVNTISVLSASNHVAFIYPFENNHTQVITTIKADTCPSNGISSENYIRYQFSANDDSSSDTQDFVGKFDYVSSTNIDTHTITLSERYNLTNVEEISGDVNIISETCDDGYVELTNGVHYLTSDQTAIITQLNDNDEEEILVALASKEISSLSDIEANYAGFIGHSHVDESPYEVIANCEGTFCTVNGLSDISDDSTTTALYTIDFDEQDINQPQEGMIEGNITSLDDGEVGHIICHADNDINTSDDEDTKIMLCVAQSPEDNSGPMNIFLVAPGDI